MMTQKDYQLCISILEAKHLVWPHLDVMVCIEIGGKKKKFTKPCKNTDTPYFNENFVFDFHITFAELRDKIINLSLIQAKKWNNLRRFRKALANACLDVATVWQQPAHQYYHKWAVLTDPTDPTGGPKGFLKCDISIIGKGDSIKIPPTSPDDDDVEKNLMFPVTTAMARRRVRYLLQFYWADDLGRGGTKWKFRDSIDPYVQVSFAGLVGRTSVRKSTTNPIWNEQLIFHEMFPPLCQRIKLDVKDHANNTVIATQYIDLKSISNSGPREFLPTFGPTLLHLYGTSARARDGESFPMQAGSDSAVYKGKLFLALKTMEITTKGPTTGVHLEQIPPVNESLYWIMENFLLFATIFDVSMMDPKLCEKPLHLEISLGNSGNSVSTSHHTEKDNLPEDQTDLISKEMLRSSSIPLRAKSTDGIFYHLPFGADKPCLAVKSTRPDTRRRMFNSNQIAHYAHLLREKLAALKAISPDDIYEPQHVQEIVNIALREWQNYNEWLKKGKQVENRKVKKETDLDKERTKMCNDIMEQVRKLAKSLKDNHNKENAKIVFYQLQRILNKADFLAEDPQHALPDVFLWLLTGRKQLAFARLTAKEMLYSTNVQEKGHNCGHRQSLLLKIPGITNPNIWGVVAKVDIYVWLGLYSDEFTFLKSLPDGYEELSEKNMDIDVPTFIHYNVKKTFELRAHISQGQFQPGSDKSALCDAFVRVVVNEQSCSTRIKTQTLNPTWDERLTFPHVDLYGSCTAIKNNPPTVVIEARDMDKRSSEFIGMAMLQPPVKLEGDEYSHPTFPPKLEWFKLFNGSRKSGEILAAFELLEISKDNKIHGLPEDDRRSRTIPNYIRPNMVNYRLEIYFWGVRGLRKVNLFPVERPRITVVCGQIIINSTTIRSTKKHPNFDNPITLKEVSLPVEEVYLPPLTIKLYDWCAGKYRYIGTHIVSSVRQFLYPMLEENTGYVRRQSIAFNRDETAVVTARKVYAAPGGSQLRELERDDYHPLTDKPTALQRNKRMSVFSLGSQIHEFEHEHADILPPEHEKKSNWNCCRNCCRRKTKKIKRKKLESRDEDKFDWWTKYYDSRAAENKKPMIKIYQSELEDQPEFKGFHDVLKTFNLHRGKVTSDEDDEQKVIGFFKGSMALYPWPPPYGSVCRTKTGLDADGGVFQDYPRNEPLAVIVRVYIIQATLLHPKDMSGKADPYIQIKFGPRVDVDDGINYVPRQLNPIFGRCYEQKANFPVDSILTIRILDHDVLGKDDLIGETKLDLEDRYMSEHRATCGLATKYHENGYNKWRDTLKPTQILENLCRKHNVEIPVYEGDSVVIGENQFQTKDHSSSGLSVEVKPMAEGTNKRQEDLALVALHNWYKVPVIGYHLVPEHIERRSLYNPIIPGIEQGKLDMWVDLFPVADVLNIKPAVEVSQRKPEKYELRVIIWNTDNVLLEESDVITGKKKADLYVLGRLTGEDEQKTDVHYNSMTGEGNFNWRFVFPFEYLPSEKQLLIHKKESLFAREETDFKLPCRLSLQIWDNDIVSRDDYIGSMTLDLHSFPHGARSARRCTLGMIKTDGSVPMINIFKQKRVKGWWPFSRRVNYKPGILLAGKLEAEMELLTGEEAEKNPVGLGRKEPEPLSNPIRPETLRWFMKPFKSLRILLWRKCKRTCCKLILLLLIVGFFFFYFYSIPGIVANKTFNFF